MDSLHFDHYTSYSDSSTPRTPSPRSLDLYPPSPHYKPAIDIEPVRNIFHDHPADDTVVPEAHTVDGQPFWNNMQPTAPFYNPARGSLLQELYEHDIPADQPIHEVYMDHSADSPYSSDWHMNPSDHHQQQHHREFSSAPRRATFPYVRHDRDDQQHQHQFGNGPFLAEANGHLLSHPYSSRQDALYGEPLPLSAEPSVLQHEPFMSSPHSSYHQLHHLDDSSVKLEDTAPVIVPSQTPFYRPATDPSCHPMTMSYLSPHTGLPVQHTDDAASKETQYLRRRCFNCHTTEPPSWRRSTLNPGKIVCNKCGLYERTHLRPRPLRFDELRAGNKSRKQSKGVVGPTGSTSPKAQPVKMSPGATLVKKEPRDVGLVRRSSISSSASSVHSGSGVSDWDDSVSVYSSGSAPPSSFNSPSVSTFPIPRDVNSQSPPMPPLDGGIRLPNAPLTDIASLQQQGSPHPQQQQLSHQPTPRKAATAPSSYYPPNAYPPQNGGSVYRRGSAPERRRDVDIPEATGWQSVPLGELKEGRARSDSTPATATVAT